MERRVIKFNLVGAIFVLILIIAAVSGIIIFAIKSQKDNNDDKNEKQMKISEEQEKKDKEADELNKEYKEKILIDNQEHWMTLKKFKSSLGYKMKYDVESFYIENNDIEVDEYKSLYTDTISLKISKSTEDFSDKTESIIKESAEKIRNNSTYKLEQMDINGDLCFKESMVENGVDNIITYYIQADNGFFVVQAHCGTELKETMIPIIDYMVKTFEA